MRSSISAGNSTPNSAYLSTKTAFGNPSEFSDDSNLGTEDIPIADLTLPNTSITLPNEPPSPPFPPSPSQHVIRKLLCPRPALPERMFYLDREFVHHWPWSVRLDLILIHLYMVIDRTNDETICTGLRITDGEILVPGHFPSRDMSRSLLQCFPEVPKIRAPKHIHNYYQISNNSRANTLFLLSNQQPSYSISKSALCERVNSTQSFLLYAWRRSFVAAPLSILQHENRDSIVTAGAVCITLNSDMNSSSYNEFVVSGFYLGHGEFLSDEEMLSHYV